MAHGSGDVALIVKQSSSEIGEDYGSMYTGMQGAQCGTGSPARLGVQRSSPGRSLEVLTGLQ